MPLVPFLTNSAPGSALYAPAGSGGGGGGGGTGPDLQLSSITFNGSNYITWPAGSNLNLFPGGGGAYSCAFYFSPGNPPQGGLTTTNALYIPSATGNTQVYFGSDSNTCFMAGDTGNGDQNSAIALLGSTVSISSLIVSSINATVPTLIDPDPEFSSIVVAQQAAVSSVVADLGLYSTLFTGAIAGTNLNSQITFMSSIDANTANLSTLYSQDLVVEDSGSVPLLTTSTLTVHQTTENPNATYDGGINFDMYAAFPHLSVGDNSTISIKSQGNWDANGISTTTLNAVQLGDFGPPLGQYDELADFAVGRLLVGGPANGVGFDFQFSGPKPFISASNAIWTNANPPSSGPAPPSLYTSPIITSNVTTSYLTGVQSIAGNLNQTIAISGTNGNGSGIPCAGLESLSWFTNPPVPSTFWSTSIYVGADQNGTDITINGSETGSVVTTCPIIEMVGSYTSTAILQVKDFGTQIFNTSGVQIGTQSNTANDEIQITPGQVNMLNVNLNVSSINNQLPAAGTVSISQSTLFTSSPLPGFAQVDVVSGALPVIIGSQFDLKGGFSYTLGGVFQHTPSSNATNSWDAGATFTVFTGSKGFRPPSVLNSTLYGRDIGYTFTWYQETDDTGALEVVYTDPVGPAASTTAQVVYTSLIRMKG